MKKQLLVLLLSIASISVMSQTHGVRYMKNINTNLDGEYIFDAKPTSDGGYVVVGTDSTYSFNVKELASKNGNGQPFIMKLDNAGNQVNFFTRVTDFINTEYSSFTSIDLTSDGGYIVTGYTAGKNFPIENRIILYKYNKNGREVWYNEFGDTGERGYSVIEATSGKIIVVGTSTSTDNIRTNKGGTDIWMICVDQTGSLLWQKSFGGSGADTAFTLIEAPDKGFIIAGSTGSTNGDITSNHGSEDAWIIKTDENGNKLWQKTYGGSEIDVFRSLIKNSDGTYTATGFTTSPNAEGYTNKGGSDLWILKFRDSDGSIIWSKGYGGSSDEEGLSISRIVGNEYLISGYTKSSDGDVTNNNGLTDGWLLKVAADGNLIWDETAGTVKEEMASSAIYNSESDFILIGSAQPPPGSFAHDFSDGWFVRFGNANKIKGTLYFDANNNGIKDPGENYYNNALVSITGAGINKSSSPINGHFEFYVGLGTYTTTVKINNNYYVVNPTSISSPSFNSYSNTDSISFAIQEVPAKNDLSVYLMPLGPARPGFGLMYKVFCKNNGTSTISNGEIIFKKDNLLEFIEAEPVPTSTGDTIKWAFTNLAPSDSLTMTVYLRVKAPPVVNYGDTLYSLASITPVPGDETPLDNSTILKQLVVGSYDPNDKNESNSGKVSPTFVSEGRYLQYLIRFQNTGTDTAFTVVVRDTLDQLLDLNTFEMITTSHPYQLQIQDNHKLAWTFPNINLPDSFINEPASHGYIAYRIKIKQTASVNDVIHNTASIYFDYNLPIVTNDAATVIALNSFTVLPISLLKFEGNFFNNEVQLNWQIHDGSRIEKFEVEKSFNGRDFFKRTEVKKTNSSSFTYKDATDLTAKAIFYRLRIIDHKNAFSYSRILKFANDQIKNDLKIYPNPVFDDAHINFYALTDNKIVIRVIDSKGNIISNLIRNVQKGQNIITLGSKGLTRGSYLLQIISNGETKTATFIIL